MQATSTDVIDRTVHIAARPETVFAFLTEAGKMSAWLGRSATIEPWPGGLFRMDYNGFDVMRGQFVEVVPHSRIVATWGWESLGASTRPGASTVTFTLEPEGDGTRLHLLHEGLVEMDLEPHSKGWDQFLSRLAARAAGGAADDASPQLSEAEEYASRLNSLLCQARETIEAVPAEKWTANTSENRALNALAAHLVDHSGLMAFAQATAAGERAPQADFTFDKLTEGNAARDRENAAVSRETVLHALKSDGPAAVEALKLMTDADLAASMPMAFAGGQPVSVRMLIEGPLLKDIADHLEHVRAAAG